MKVRSLTLLLVAQVAAMSLWFITAAVLPDIARETALSPLRQAALAPMRPRQAHRPWPVARRFRWDSFAPAPTVSWWSAMDNSLVLAAAKEITTPSTPDSRTSTLLPPPRIRTASPASLAAF